LHRRRVRDQTAANGALRYEASVVQSKMSRLERALREHGDFIDVERLREIVVGARFHGLDSCLL
jgi:hypothetical protein